MCFGGGATFASNDITLHGSVIAKQVDVMDLGNPLGAFSDGTLSTFGAGTFVAAGFVWGSFAVTLGPGGRYVNLTGSTFVLKALLTSGALTLGTKTTGSYYTSSTGLWVGAITLTPANIDTNNSTIGSGGALVEPSTGAGFSGLNGN